MFVLCYCLYPRHSIVTSTSNLYFLIAFERHLGVIQLFWSKLKVEVKYTCTEVVKYHAIKMCEDLEVQFILF